jgi:hypothetical protein
VPVDRRQRKGTKSSQAEGRKLWHPGWNGEQNAPAIASQEWSAPCSDAPFPTHDGTGDIRQRELLAANNSAYLARDGRYRLILKLQRESSVSLGVL